MFSTMAVFLKSGDDKMDMSASGMDDNWGNDYDDMEGSDDEWEDNEWDDEYDDMQSSAKRLFTALVSLAAVLAVNL